MAKKKKKSTRGSKEVSRTVGFKKSIVLCKLASEKVIIPDFPVHFKKRARASGAAFVNESCIQRQDSLVCTGYPIDVNEKNLQGTRVKKRKGRKSPGVSFVPISCLTETTTPVQGFETLKKSDNTVTTTVSGSTVSRKKIRNRKMVEFVPMGCITDRVSQGYQRVISASKDKVPDVLDSARNTVRKRSPKNDPLTSFVPRSCITPTVSQTYKPVKEPLKQKFFNPCPELPALAPDIIGGIKKTNQRRFSAHTSFVSGDCINASVSIPYTKPKEKPVIKYVYVDRPNSPDVFGPSPRKKRRKSSEVIPFVSKSCTIEKKVIQEHRTATSRAEALALIEPESQPNTRINVWYLSAILFVLLLFVLLVILAYFLEK